MRYQWQHARPDDDGGFDVDGRIVHVAPTSTDPTRGAYLLVEVEERQDIPAEFAGDAEGVTCAGKGGKCSRAVDAPGDFCWQHEDEQ